MAIEVRDAWIGIQGGTCAGKTTLAETLAQEIGPADVLIVSLDLFYRPIEKRFLQDPSGINFDTPSSLDWELLREAIRRLKSGISTVIKVYDGLTLSRELQLDPKKYIVVEGLWAFNESFLSDLFDCRLYVETSPDVRLIRRLRRDVIDLGEVTLNEMLSYYLNCIRPMHLKFVEPGKADSDLVLDGERPIDDEVRRVIELLNQKCLTNLL